MQEVKTVADTQKYLISTKLLMQEALTRGYEVGFFAAAPSTKGGITRCAKGGKELFFKGTNGAITPSYGVYAAQDKYLMYNIFKNGGICTPDTMVLTPDQSATDASSFLSEHGVVVVKPCAMNHGDGVTVGIKSADMLERAVSFAREKSGPEADIIIQPQVSGQEYRFLVVDNKVIAVAARRPPFVIGDGISTVAKLIDEKNQDPRRGDGHTSPLTIINLEDVAHHRGDDFLAMVVPTGESVNVLDTSNLSRGGESEDFTEIASPVLKQLALAAAKVTHLGVAGVDIMTNDITAPNTLESFVIEVNLSPGLRMHQFPTIGQPRDVAKTIFDYFETTTRPISELN